MCDCAINNATVRQLAERIWPFTGCLLRKLPREASRLSTWGGLAVEALLKSTSLPVRIF